MPLTMDVFNDDAFSVINLTKGINETTYKPGRISSLGLFMEEGISTTAVMIEKRKNGLAIVPAKARGAEGTPVTGDKANAVAFKTTHLPLVAQILADEIIGKRAFGTTDQEMVEAVVNRRLQKMRNAIDVTIEFQRIGAIIGKILDADGSVLLDVYDAFGLTQQSHSLKLGTESTKVRTKVREGIRMSEDALEANVDGYRALCGRIFFDSFCDHKAVADAYQRYNQGEMLRNDPRGGFDFADVRWEEYRGKLNGQKFVADDKAYLVPEGVADMFVTNFAPADYMETVGTDGLPYYAKQEPGRMGKSVELEAQSNPLNLCTMPQGIIELTL
ncbi:elements of external origin [Endozoicomonas montiporae]|uniref:Elements of external origin n=2 Tax=Endozoicomonas montiporae TaxID=1027273 RepID=A0A081N7T0_9GAMM|nr:major capsid protein [Endozoicomonas montiporae]AMO55634.1 phage major capsid protein E [Endozoicomonas montiporae CL-33]KEQ14503.1 elements of external origin [Endozoicomonas montiporae]